jgi:hypothetical protein
MFSKNFVGVTLSLCLLVACGGDESPAATSGPRLVEARQSACKKTSEAHDALTGGLTATWQASGTLQITHLDVEENCAAKIAATVKVTPPTTSAKGIIVVEETVTNPGQAADCICHFDVIAVVEGLVAGTYEVSVLSPSKQSTGPIEVTTATAPTPSATVSSLQSACKQNSDSSEDGFSGNLKASVQGGTVTVEHLSVEENCAAKLVAKATVTLPAAGAAGTMPRSSSRRPPSPCRRRARRAPSTSRRC